MLGVPLDDAVDGVPGVRVGLAGRLDGRDRGFAPLLARDRPCTGVDELLADSKLLLLVEVIGLSVPLLVAAAAAAAALIVALFHNDSALPPPPGVVVTGDPNGAPLGFGR